MNLPTITAVKPRGAKSLFEKFPVVIPCPNIPRTEAPPRITRMSPKIFMFIFSYWFYRVELSIKNCWLKFLLKPTSFSSKANRLE
jgi:hypothetical protein